MSVPLLLHNNCKYTLTNTHAYISLRRRHLLTIAYETIHGTLINKLLRVILLKHFLCLYFKKTVAPAEDGLKVSLLNKPDLERSHQHCKKQAAVYITGRDHTLLKKAARNSDVDKCGAHQTTWGSKNSFSYVLWFCATVVHIGIRHIPAWLFFYSACKYVKAR
jgi:hypothetical protein